ncbi:MAG: hypothetical protein BWY79_01388 [Actinobacteria bacterium ADurb.Bin444]|nr:MAG: hypothetical protein BWY79_01388 [Actinobacteria bacterium ADurb.Bin444]
MGSSSGTANTRPFAHILTIRMRLRVSVPVLSTQRVVAEPRASTAGMRRVNTPFWLMRQAPSARNTVKTTGISSGRMAMAKVMPARRPSIQPPRVSL